MVASGLYQPILSLVQKAYVTNWHNRLGHPGETAIKAAAKIYRFQPKDATSCDSCQKGKAVKIINRAATRIAGDALGYLHADIIGPFPAPRIEESRFYLTVDHEYSRFVPVFSV